MRLADERLAHARTGQLAIREILDEHLRYIDWDQQGTAKRLHLPQFPGGADVSIDPRFGRGASVLGESKVRVADIVDLWRAGERIEDVAEEYGLSVTVVEDVLRQAA